MAELDKYLKYVQTVRIWYGNNAEDLCGLYFICAHLISKDFEGSIIGNCSEDGVLWEHLDSDEIGNYISHGIDITTAESQIYKKKWDKLVEDNAILRVYQDGDVVGAEEEYYDEQISLSLRKECMNVASMWANWAHKDEITAFKNDEWFYYRVNCMLRDKKLEIVEETKYSRKVKRTELLPLPEEEIIRRAAEDAWENVHSKIENQLESMDQKQLEKILTFLKELY